MGSKLEVSTGQFSDQGRKPSNQDFYGAMLPLDRLLKTKGIALAIADGVSSSDRGGEAAAACVMGFLEDYFSTPESWSVQKSAQQVLTALNTWLYSQGQRGSGNGLVSTLSVLILKSTTAHLFHVGDSRIYYLHDQDLEQLTRDHRTYISGGKNYLSRAMGADLHLEIDYRKLAVSENDVFILTTDGVHEYHSGKEIARIVRENSVNLDKAAERIVQAALGNQSPDNATCQILRIDGLPSQEPEDVYQELTELPFPPELSAGMILDGYRIVREIHASKRTQIYLAIDAESGSRVALKMPSVNYEDDPAYIEHFILEEWIGRRIDNPHVVKVFPPTRRRRFLYHVTEFLEGSILRQWMRDHPSPDLETVRGLIEQIAKGLRAFHRLEMVHQDLKPENIVIDPLGNVKLVDFGSTRVAGFAEITTPIERLHLLGTKNYTAPEYFCNQPGTSASDVYSLGVIAYEMLTGRLPYGEMPANWPTAKSLTGLTYTPATDHNQAIPRWVDGALRKAVHPDPKQRYNELSEFLYDLRHPNQQLIKAGYRPLLERNPVAFWRGVSIILLLLNLLWLYLLAHQ